MTVQQKKWLQPVLLAALLVTMFFNLTQTAHAQGIIFGDTVPQGVTLDNDIILVGDEVVVDGNLNGNLLAIGRMVTISGTVDGSAIILAGIADIRNVINGSLYNASGETNLGANGLVGRDLYYAGGSLNVQPEASIGRDLYAFTGGAQLTKNIGRDVVAVIGPYEMLKVLYKALNGKFNLPPIEIPFLSLRPAARPAGGLAAAAAVPFQLAGVGAPSAAPSAQTSGVDWPVVGDWALGRLREFIVLLLIGGLLLWLMPARLEAWVKRSMQKPWLLMLYGLGYIIIAFAGAGIILVHDPGGQLRPRRPDPHQPGFSVRDAGHARCGPGFLHFLPARFLCQQGGGCRAGRFAHRAQAGAQCELCIVSGPSCSACSCTSCWFRSPTWVSCCHSWQSFSDLAPWRRCSWQSGGRWMTPSVPVVDVEI